MWIVFIAIFCRIVESAASLTLTEYQGDTSCLNKVKHIFSNNGNSNIVTKSKNICSIPKYFVIDFWVMHLGCVLRNSSQRTLMYKPGHFEWEFNVKSNHYSITIKNGILSRSISVNLTSDFAYGKWMHFSFFNVPNTGLKLYLYSRTLLVSENAPIEIENLNLNFIYVGSRESATYNNFDGVINQIWVLDSFLNIEELHKYLRLLRKHYELPKVYLTDQSVPALNKILFDPRLEGVWISDPLEMARGYYPYYGEEFFSNSTFAFFNGKSYVKYKRENLGLQFKIFYISFWFKYVPIVDSQERQTLVESPRVFKIMYYPAKSTEKSSRVELNCIRAKNAVSVSLPPYSRHWTQILATLDFLNNQIQLQAAGFSQSSAALSTLSEIPDLLEITLGNDPERKGFTGFIREFLLSTKDKLNLIPAIGQYKQKHIDYFFDHRDFYIQLIGTLNPVNYGVNFVLQSEHQMSLVSDSSPVVLCNEGLNSVFDYRNDKVLCQETFFAHSGYDISSNNLSLPLPTNKWTNSGSLCLTIQIIKSFSSFQNAELISLGNFNITATCVGFHILKFAINDGTTELFYSEIEYKRNKWISLCFSFELQGSGNHILYISNTRFSQRKASAEIPPRSFTPTGEFRVAPHNPEITILLKDILVLNRAITLPEQIIYHFMHPELAPFLSGVSAFWPLNESGTFQELVGHLELPRANTSLSYSGIYSNLLENGCVYHEIYSKPPQDYFSLYSTEKNTTLTASLFLLSIDFKDIVRRNYTFSMIPLLSDVILEIAGKQEKPVEGFFSSYLGLVITPSYADYIATIPIEIDKGWLSIWFNKNDGTDKVLLSGYGGVSLGTQFRIIIGTYLKLQGPNLSTASDPVPIATNTWNHLFLVWKVTNILQIGYVLNSMSLVSLSVPSAGFSQLSDRHLVLGASRDSTGAVESITIFEGYIRRVDVLNMPIYKLEFTDLIGMLPGILNKFVQSQNCDQQFAACSRCDSLTKECFSTAPFDRTPNNAFACPAECNADLHTSCDSATTCSKCEAEFCLACEGSRCLRCFSNLFPNEEGVCQCLEGFVFNQSTGKCEPCSGNCQSCTTSNNEYSCINCKPSTYLHNASISKYISGVTTGQCLPFCPAGYKVVNNFCEINCHYTCMTCNKGKDPNQCSSCRNNMYLLTFPLGPCVYFCPSNYVIINSTYCQLCDPSCGTCEIPNNASSCLTCANSMAYFTRGNNSLTGTCTESCYLTNTYTDIQTRTCVHPKCPREKFQDEEKKQCLPCHRRCFECSEPDNPLKCKGCSNLFPYFRLESPRAKFGRCDSACGVGEVVAPGSPFVCYPISVKYQNFEYSAQNINIILGLIFAGFCFIELITKGSLSCVADFLGPLQVLLFLGYIDISEPLQSFVKHINVPVLSFIPNVMRLFRTDIELSEVNHPSLKYLLFLDNIGYVLFIGLIYIILVTLTWIWKHSKIAGRIYNRKLSLLHEIGMGLVGPVWLASLHQITHSNSERGLLNATSSVLSAVFIGIILCYISAIFYLLHRVRPHLTDSNTKKTFSVLYGSFINSTLSYYSILVYLVLLQIIPVIMIVLFSPHSLAQFFSLLVCCLASLNWNLWIRPYKHFWRKIQTLLADSINIILFSIYLINEIVDFSEVAGMLGYWLILGYFVANAAIYVLHIWREKLVKNKYKIRELPSESKVFSHRTGNITT